MEQTETSLVPFHMIPVIRNVKMTMIAKVCLKERGLIVVILLQRRTQKVNKRSGIKKEMVKYGGNRLSRVVCGTCP